jgi:hypothetical protein
VLNNNKYILEVKTDLCVYISFYSKNKSGFKKALMKAQSLMAVKKIFSAKIFCSASKEEVWSLGK